MTRPWPTQVKTGRVTGTIYAALPDASDVGSAPDAVAIPGLSIAFVPSIDRIHAPGLILHLRRFEVGWDEASGQIWHGGQKYIELVATDSPGVQPADWTWTCVITAPQIGQWAFPIQVPADGTVDLADIAPIQTSKGEWITRGKSAYDIAVDQGFKGTEAQWLTTLQGAGAVRYDIAQTLTAADRTRASTNVLGNGTFTGDLNDLISTSITLVAAAAANKPVLGGGILWSVAPYPSIAMQHYADYAGGVFTRAYNNNNNWSAWRRGGNPDTGWRSLLLAPQWSGPLLLARHADTVTLTGTLKGPTVAGNQLPLPSPLPTGFRPVRQVAAPLSANQSVSAPTWAKLRVHPGGPVLVGSGAINNIDSDGFSISWQTADPWPSTLPGTPV